MAEDATPVASSATDTPAEPSFAEFKSAFLAERSGQPIEPTKEPAAAADTPERAEGTPSSTPAASEPAKAGHKGNADTRKVELQREIDELLTQRAMLRREVEHEQRAAPRTEPAHPASQPAAEDKEPQIEDFSDKPDPYAAYVAALGRYHARQEFKAQQQTVDRQRQQDQLGQREQQRAEKFREALKAEHEKDPAWLDGISEEVKGLKPFSALKPDEPRSVLNGIAEELLDAPNPAALMRHFTDHPEEMRRIAGLPALAVVREMARLSERLAHPKTPPKTVSDAPPPPPTVGTRQGEATDAEAAAINSGDMRGLKRAMQQEHAARFARR